MSTSLDPTLRGLNDCGCCEGLAVRTPVAVRNRPGLSAIAYRVGAHAEFKQTLVARLDDPAAAPPLRGLTTRDDGDFTVALLDAWATVSDVLTFYQERIANESYLRTATERLSVLELARLIGYELRPGVAATTYLAFTMEKAPGVTPQQARSLGVPSRTVLNPGIKVQSIPGPDEQPQMFETVERIEARVAWNAIRPRLTVRHPVMWDTDTFYFDGLATGLKRGDGILVTPYGQDSIFRQVASVANDNERQMTRVRLSPLHKGASSTYSSVFDGYDKGEPVAAFVKPYLGKVVDAADLRAEAAAKDFEARALFDNLLAARDPAPRLLVFRARAAIFGHNAAPWHALPGSQRYGEWSKNTFLQGAYRYRADSWIDQRLSDYHGIGNFNYIYLDNVYPGVVKHSWIVLKEGDEAKAYRVNAVAEETHADFGLSAKVTRLTVDTRSYWSDFRPRHVTVYCHSEELELARYPHPNRAISGSHIELDTFVEGLSAGQHVVFSGALSDRRGATASEVATIAKVEHVLTPEGFTRLTLAVPLAHAYVRDTVAINANVALATHGETLREVLGGGDATKPFQAFTLRQPPLTYTSAATPTGTQTTLSVRVGGVLWREVPSFYGRGPEERIYVTHTDDDGKTAVRFGDGVTGARLPTGQDNVVATYRRGSGLGGMLKADQLSQLMTRPLGVKGAVNPSPAEGASAPESLKEARRNAPLTVMTLERIVSLRDYEDFARAFAGVGKALATWTWNGERRGVFVTVAGADGASLAPDGVIAKNLLGAMRAAGDPFAPLALGFYKPRRFRLKAKVKVDEDYDSAAVLAAVERDLRDRFSFEAREFGRPVMLSEVVAVMQGAPGVVAVDVDELYVVPNLIQLLPVAIKLSPVALKLSPVVSQPAPPIFQLAPNLLLLTLNPGLFKLQARLPAAAPRAGSTKPFAAELLTLDPAPLKLEVMP
jgi:predicted phage baseplate assembly protein